MMDVAKKKSCLHYTLYHLLIMKYKYANLIFDLILSFIWFCSQCRSRKKHALGSEHLDMVF